MLAFHFIFKILFGMEDNKVIIKYAFTLDYLIFNVEEQAFKRITN